MDDITIRLECLKLAAASHPHEAVEEAGRLYAFVTGKPSDDAKAKLALVRAAIG